jgi:hypothetical protein
LLLLLLLSPNPNLDPSIDAPWMTTRMPDLTMPSTASSAELQLRGL